MTLFSSLAPELLLVAVACALFFLGTSLKASSRRASALVALVALVAVFGWQLGAFLSDPGASGASDDWNVLRVSGFTTFVKAMVAGVGCLLVLLAWPSDADGTGSPSFNVGHEVGEFFALALLALAGVMLVAGANDIVLLFLGIELAAIPTYIMVSISRPLPVAQEAGVKYFFLGAMAAAVMLFGFSYVYGTTGQIKLDAIAAAVDATRDPASNGWGQPAVGAWMLLGVVVLLAGFAFKIAAVPLHAYAGDVYQGAATPVTALLAFVPKTSGFVAIIKLLAAVGGARWAVPELVVQVLWVVAALTMTVGNVLGLIQLNVKRVFAYSSIAHSGYMLVGVTALAAAASAPIGRGQAADVQRMALQGVLFYLLAYGVTNAGAFGILMLFPTRAHKQAGDDEAEPPVATTAETFEDLAGQGRVHPMLGMGMAVCCFSLIGLPLTVGFFGKYLLVLPALNAGLYGLVVLTVLNAAVSAAYYLKVVATLFLRPAPAEHPESHLVTLAAATAAVAANPEHGHAHPHAHPHHPHHEVLPHRGLPLSVGVSVAVVGTVFLGVMLPVVDAITTRLRQAGPTVAVIATPPATRPVGGPATGPMPRPDAPLPAAAAAVER